MKLRRFVGVSRPYETSTKIPVLVVCFWLPAVLADPSTDTAVACLQVAVADFQQLIMILKLMYCILKSYTLIKTRSVLRIVKVNL